MLVNLRVKDKMTITKSSIQYSEQGHSQQCLNPSDPRDIKIFLESVVVVDIQMVGCLTFFNLSRMKSKFGKLL